MAMVKSAVRVMVAMAMAKSVNPVPRDVVDLVLSYWDPRCTFCDAGKGCTVRDGGRRWQVWCMTCALHLSPSESSLVCSLHAPCLHSCCPNRGSVDS